MKVYTYNVKKTLADGTEAVYTYNKIYNSKKQEEYLNDPVLLASIKMKRDMGVPIKKIAADHGLSVYKVNKLIFSEKDPIS